MHSMYIQKETGYHLYTHLDFNILSFVFCRWSERVYSFSRLVGKECTDTLQCEGGDVCCPETDQCEDPLTIDPSACGKT